MEGPFAKRTNWNQEANVLSLFLDELKFHGKDIIDLTESNPTRCGFEYPTVVTDVLSNPANLLYAPDSCGMVNARHAIGEFCDFNPKHILLTSSSSESYSFIFRLLINPGDKVLIPAPSYPLFQFLLELNDACFAHYPLVFDGQWRIDFKALERLIDGRTKAIVIVNPNNPTGSYIKDEELKQLNTICRKYGLSIISDEVFYDYQLKEGAYPSLKKNAEVLTFVLGGLSKSLGLPQMKLGWVLVSGPSPVLEGALSRLEIIADTYLSVSTPVQNAVAAWLTSAPIIQNQIMQRLKTNLDFLIGAGFKVLGGEGGWYVIVDLGQMDEESFVLEALRRHHILTHPGFFFDMDAGSHLVLSLLPKPENFVRIRNIEI